MLSDQQISRAFDKTREYVLSGHLPCAAVAVADRERIIAQIGYDKEGRETPGLLKGVYALASISKAITGIGAAVLYDEGKLRYDVPMCSYLPDFGVDEARRTMTLANIFTHSTGLPSRFAAEFAGIENPMAHLFKLLREDPLQFPPGTRMSYSTYTYQLVNAVVEQLTGMKLSVFLQDRVFGPCGIADTGFWPDAARAMPVVDHPIPEGPAMKTFCDLEISGGGMWSTLKDLVTLGQAWLTPGKLVSQATFDYVTAPQPGLPMLGDETVRSCRTLGFVKEKQGMFPRQPDAGFYHGGATGTLWWMDPERSLIFVFLTTRWGSGNEHAFDVLNCLY